MINMAPFYQHERIALSFSGGKDSLACVHMLRDYLKDITVYHLDTGDLLPEMAASVSRVELGVPNFVRIETHVARWIERHGLPTDLLPYSTHPVGRAMGEPKVKLAPRYDCCYSNLMKPPFDRVVADGNTLLIRGTKAVDMKRLPVQSGDNSNGISYWYPLQAWSNEDVMRYLRENDVPIPRVYETMTNAPECARCSAWWGEGRGAYLKAHHPELYKDYATRLRVVAGELAPILDNLEVELL